MSEYMKQLISGEALKEGEKELAEIQKEALDDVLEESNGKLEKWEPKEWRAEYQIIVTLSTLGYSQQDISDIMREKYQYSITKQHVANILNCEQGKKLREGFNNEVVERTKATVEEHLDKLEELAASRLVQLLEDDVLYKAHPFAVADRSIKILEGRNKLKTQILDHAKGNTTNNQQNLFFSLPPEILARIETGMKKTLLVDEIHGPNQRSRSGENAGSEVKRSGTDG